MRTVIGALVRTLVLAATLALASGCAAMMMSGESGTYRPPADECDDGEKDGKPCRRE